MCGNIHLLDPTYNGKQIAGYSRFSWVLIKRMLILLTYMLLQNKYSFSCLWHDGPSCHTSDAATCNIELFSMDCTRNNFVKTKVQLYTHKIQHLNSATYSEITTFSRNKTKHTIKVGNWCNFLSKRLTQKLQLFSWNLPFFGLFFSIFF